MPNTYTLIKGETIGSSAASYTFTAIPSSFTDLVLRVSARGTDAALLRGLTIAFNSIGGTSYSEIAVSGNGSTASSFISSNQAISGLGVVSANNATANIFGSVESYIPSYTAAQNKPIGSNSAAEDNNTTATIRGNAGLFRDTVAINSIVLTLNSGDFAANSSFYLYGIKKS